MQDDLRDYEYKYRYEVLLHIQKLHPNFFEVESYVHPVLGERYNIIITTPKQCIDLASISSFKQDFVNNCIIISSLSGDIIVKDLIHDDTVVTL